MHYTPENIFVPTLACLVEKAEQSGVSRSEALRRVLAERYNYPSQKAIKEYRRKIEGLTKLHSTLSEVETLYRVNLVTVGWGNYFRYENSYRTS